MLAEKGFNCLQVDLTRGPKDNSTVNDSSGLVHVLAEGR